MGNKKGRNYDNYSALSNYIKGLIERGEYRIEDNNIEIKDIEGTSIIINTTTGDLYRYDVNMNLKRVQAGENKENGRTYVKFPIDGEENFYMVNYVAMIALGVLSSDSEVVNMSERWHNEYSNVGDGKLVINHKDGNVKNNSYSNLELTTSKLNNAHGRLLHEIHYYFGDDYTETYGKTDRLIRLINGNSISCKDIEKFNSANPKLAIKNFRENGLFAPHYTKAQLKYIIKYFNLKKHYVEKEPDAFKLKVLEREKAIEEQTRQIYDLLRARGVNIIDTSKYIG